MIVTVEPVLLPPPISAVSTPRSEGIHLSGIIRAMATEMGLLAYEPIEDLTLVERGAEQSEAWWDNLDNSSKLRIAIGLAWEQWYISQLPEVVDHPGEMCVSGVYMTPDGEELAVILQQRGLSLIIHEVKATYKSTKTVGVLSDIPLQSQWMWIKQIQGYCKGAGTRFAVLHVLFLCGDYSWPQRPQLHKFTIEFTQDEIDKAWDTMTEYRDDWMRTRGV